MFVFGLSSCVGRNRMNLDTEFGTEYHVTIFHVTIFLTLEVLSDLFCLDRIKVKTYGNQIG